MELLDSVEVLACLLGGLWIWRRLRGFGFDGLLAVVLTLLALWFVGQLIWSVYLAICHALTWFIDSVGVLLGLVLAGLVLGAIWAVRFWRVHQQARRFFDR